MSSAQGAPHIIPPPPPPPPAPPPPQPQQPKQKISPMELRNADLVSRLLAATPPYLYNMSILPNTYFFSELLRSFVQLKNEQNSPRGNSTITNIPNGYLGTTPIYYGHQTMRRTKKRPWNMDTARIETITRNTTGDERKLEKTNEKHDNNEPWMIKSMRRNDEAASTSTAGPRPTEMNCNLHRYVDTPESNIPSKPDDQQTFHFPPHIENTSNLVLPPPPPIWYPPIFSAAHPPYGFDPLNFFIDFKPSSSSSSSSANDQLVNNSALCQQQSTTARDNTNLTSSTSTSTGSPSTIVSGQLLPDKNDDDPDIKVEDLSSGSENFKSHRHRSAFNVPNGTFGRPNKEKSSTAYKKFDVKSMGFDKSPNKIGLSYVLTHIREIYRNLTAASNQSNAHSSTHRINSTSYNYHNRHAVDNKASRQGDNSNANLTNNNNNNINNNNNNINNNNNGGASSSSSSSNSGGNTSCKEQKKVDDLRALIGLELVVDYMSHKKRATAMFCNNNNNSANFCDYEKNINESDDIESVGSPPLEVVEVHSDV